MTPAFFFFFWQGFVHFSHWMLAVYSQLLEVHKELAFLYTFAFPFFAFSFLINEAFWWSLLDAVMANSAEVRLTTGLNMATWQLM